MEHHRPPLFYCVARSRNLDRCNADHQEQGGISESIASSGRGCRLIYCNVAHDKLQPKIDINVYYSLSINL